MARVRHAVAGRLDREGVALDVIDIHTCEARRSPRAKGLASFADIEHARPWTKDGLRFAFLSREFSGVYRLYALDLRSEQPSLQCLVTTKPPMMIHARLMQWSEDEKNLQYLQESLHASGPKKKKVVVPGR